MRVGECSVYVWERGSLRYGLQMLMSGCRDRESECVSERKSAECATERGLLRYRSQTLESGCRDAWRVCVSERECV